MSVFVGHHVRVGHLLASLLLGVGVGPTVGFGVSAGAGPDAAGEVVVVDG